MELERAIGAQSTPKGFHLAHLVVRIDYFLYPNLFSSMNRAVRWRGDTNGRHYDRENRFND